jgi:hypothetical protein
MNLPGERPTAICVLGMHRSGTSSITRAINLLGAYLGEEEKFRNTSVDNAKGHWEHPDIYAIQMRLLTQLNRPWDTVMPLPEDWCQSDAVRPFKAELTRFVTTAFGGRSLWAWKDPRTCLLLPLWREILQELDTNLLCVFVVRNPLDVASSLAGRNSLGLNHGLGAWFHHNITALTDAAGLPTVFLSYERFLEAWEPELRRCVAGLGLNWPQDEAQLRANLESFIDPKLRHNQAPPDQLQGLPPPVQELYQVLSDACLSSTGRDEHFEETVNRLAGEFHAYAALFETAASPPKSGGFSRTWQRWQRSVRKRMPSAAPAR